MDRRDFLKTITGAIAGGTYVVIVSRLDDPNSWTADNIETVRGMLEATKDRDPPQMGRLDGFRFIESPSVHDWPQPERPRQKVNAFIHQRAGHYGF
jgi:hypothetical protein